MCAGRAYVELLADDKPLENGLQSAQQEFSRYAAQVAGTQQKTSAIQKQADQAAAAGDNSRAIRSRWLRFCSVLFRLVPSGSNGQKT